MTIEIFKQVKAFFYQVMRQTNTRHLSWMKQFAGRLQSEIVTPMGASVPPLLSQAIAEHAAAVTHEDACYLIITKSEYTTEIAGLDKQRDTKWVGVKSMADALSRIGTPEQQQIAAQFLDLSAHYKIDISERYDDQTTKMDQLLQVLKTSEWTPRLAALGLTATIAELESINQQMKHLIEQRNNELATITPQAMLLARQATDEAYQLAVGVLNAFAITQWTNGASPYDTAIARINQDQDYYEKNVFAQAKGGASSGSGSASTDPSQPGDSGQQSGDNSGQQSGDNSGQQPGGDTPDPGTGGGTDTPVTPDPGTGGGGTTPGPDDPTNSED